MSLNPQRIYLNGLESAFNIILTKVKRLRHSKILELESVYKPGVLEELITIIEHEIEQVNNGGY